jgi:hypothetical protein
MPGFCKNEKTFSFVLDSATAQRVGYIPYLSWAIR